MAFSPSASGSPASDSLQNGLATLAATRASNDVDDFDGFIGVVAEFMLSVTIAEGFLDPFADFGLGLLAAADGGKRIELKFLVCEGCGES